MLSTPIHVLPKTRNQRALFSFEEKGPKTAPPGTIRVSMGLKGLYGVGGGLFADQNLEHRGGQVGVSEVLKQG